jgi:hypothetical protein
MEWNEAKTNTLFDICPLFLHAFSVHYVFNFIFLESKVQKLYWKYSGIHLMSTFICRSSSEWHSSFDGQVLSYILYVLKVWCILLHQLELTSLYQWHSRWPEQIWPNHWGFNAFPTRVLCPTRVRLSNFSMLGKNWCLGIIGYS